jgi:hypothetical protein
MEVIFKDELAELIWENYYTLTTTAIEALQIIWSEYEDIANWVALEHDVSERKLLETLSLLVVKVSSMSVADRHTPAMDYLPASQSR